MKRLAKWLTLYVTAPCILMITCISFLPEVPPTPEEAAAAATELAQEQELCEDMRVELIRQIKNYRVDSWSRTAARFYDRTSGVGSLCSYLHHATRDLRKPYTGGSVSQADLELAFSVIVSRNDYGMGVHEDTVMNTRAKAEQKARAEARTLDRAGSQPADSPYIWKEGS